MSVTKILFATVDLIGAKRYTKALQLEGYEVHSAFNGVDVLRTLEHSHYDFDVIVMELGIPGLEGYDLNDHIALQSGESIPIIAVAELPKDEDILENSGESFAIVFEKGYSREDLLSAISSLTESYEEEHHQLSADELKRFASEMAQTQTVVLDREEILGDIGVDKGPNQAREDLMNSLRNK